jgi:hypothetical protein
MPRKITHQNVNPRAAVSRPTPHWSTIVLGLSTSAVIVISMLVDDAISSPLWWVGVGVVSVTWWYVRRRTQAIAETAAANLDERELATRNVAAWWGQMVMLVLGAGTAIMLSVASRLDGPSAEAALQKSGGIVLSFVIFGAAVPTLVVASVLTAAADFDDEAGDDLPDDGTP